MLFPVMNSVKRHIERIDLVAERFWQIKLDSGLILKLPRKVNELVLGRVEALLASNKISIWPWTP